MDKERHTFLDKLTMKQAGRKFRAFIICVVASTIAIAAATQLPVLATILPAYLTSLGGFLSAYLAGNIVHRHVTLKNNKGDSNYGTE